MIDEPDFDAVPEELVSPQSGHPALFVDEEDDSSATTDPATFAVGLEAQPAPEVEGANANAAATMCLGLPVMRVVRTPNFGDALLFSVFLAMAFLVTMGAWGLALYFHWFGLRNVSDAAAKTGVTLAIEVMIYGFALAGAVPFFRMAWGRGYFAGIHWHGGTAYRRRYWLVGAALLCNGIAILGNLVLPFPKEAPVDKLFDTSADAWLLLVFGVTVAPFFEEMIFRGFLVPAMATAWDWCRERMTGAQPQPLDAEGNPVWSRFAMLFAALTVSVPFALMHADQVGKAWGPLVLLYCVSLILCAVRLAARSLAASTLVHSMYNFMLFSMMLVQTGGFRHMDNM